MPGSKHSRYVDDLDALVSELPDASRGAFLGDNARRLFGIDA
jgi:hypothetical protein